MNNFFETLYDSLKRNELMMIDGGLCRYHIRRDGQLTIYEILSSRPGAGTEILNRLKQMTGIKSLFAKCPLDLSANDWYKKKGFVLEGQYTYRTGKFVNMWRLTL